MSWDAALESDEQAAELARQETAASTENPDILYERDGVSADGVTYRPVKSNTDVSPEELPEVEVSSYTEADRIAYDIENDLALAEFPAEDQWVRIDRKHEGPEGIVYMMDTYLEDDSTTVTKNRDEDFVRIYGSRGSAVEDKNTVSTQIELFETMRDDVQRIVNNRYSLDIAEAGSSIFNVRTQIDDIFNNEAESEEFLDEIRTNPTKNKGNRHRWRRWGKQGENHPLGYKEVGSGRDNRMLYIRDDASKKVAIAAAGDHNSLDSKGLWQPNNPTDVISGLLEWSLERDENIRLEDYEDAFSAVGIDLD